MKIYFASSIRGGNSNWGDIKNIINILKGYGEVINENIEWNHSTNINPPSDEEIYRRDMKYLNHADILIADVSAPSLGVGYEICVMLSLKKPVICIWNSSVEKISAIIKGNPQIPAGYCFAYDSPDKIITFLDRIEKNWHLL